MPLESLPQELQLQIFSEAASSISFTISATPPDDPSPDLPFAFSTSYSSAVGNIATYETHRTAMLQYIINDAAVISVNIIDLNFTNLVLLLHTLHHHNQLPSFTLRLRPTFDANGRRAIIPPRRFELLYTTTTRFPTSTRKIKAFDKLAQSLTEPGSEPSKRNAAPLNCAHWVVECQSIKALEKFSMHVGMVLNEEGAHVAGCVGAVRRELKEDLERRQEEMGRRGREMEGLEDGDGDGDEGEDEDADEVDEARGDVEEGDEVE